MSAPASDTGLHWMFADSSEIPPGRQWLSPRERRIEAGLRFPKRRADWRLGRWAAKRAVRALADELDRNLRHIEILAAPNGAPQALVVGVPARHSISISHSSGRALISAATARLVHGCDLETIEERGAAFVSDYFTTKERRLVARAQGTRRTLLITLIWCLKESTLKAMGEGLRLDTREVEVTLPGRPGFGVSWARASIRHRETGSIFRGWWRLVGGQIAALAVAPPAGQDPTSPGHAPVELGRAQWPPGTFRRPSA